MVCLRGFFQVLRPLGRPWSLGPLVLTLPQPIDGPKSESACLIRRTKACSKLEAAFAAEDRNTTQHNSGLNPALVLVGGTTTKETLVMKKQVRLMETSSSLQVRKGWVYRPPGKRCCCFSLYHTGRTRPPVGICGTYYR